MTLVIIGVAALFLWLFPALRCAVTHPFHCLYYAAKDGYKYIKYKQGNLRKTGNLDIFCGYFGNGKTLSLVKQVVCREYKRYDGLQVWCSRRNKFVTQRILILSNVDLCVPYEPLTGLAQACVRQWGFLSSRFMRQTILGMMLFLHDNTKFVCVHGFKTDYFHQFKRFNLAIIVYAHVGITSNQFIIFIEYKHIVMQRSVQKFTKSHFCTYTFKKSPV